MSVEAELWAVDARRAMQSGRPEVIKAQQARTIEAQQYGDITEPERDAILNILQRPEQEPVEAGA